MLVCGYFLAGNGRRKGTNVRKVMEDRTAMLAHFLRLGQFIGLAGSSSTGSFQ
jgi:hypothetical protein